MTPVEAAQETLGRWCDTEGVGGLRFWRHEGEVVMKAWLDFEAGRVNIEAWGNPMAEPLYRGHVPLRGLNVDDLQGLIIEATGVAKRWAEGGEV